MQDDDAHLAKGAKAAPGRFILWLDQPLLGRRCILGWLLATTVFLGGVALLGGPSANDSGESLYSTWAIAHGDFRCTYPHVTEGMARGYLSIYLPGPHVPPLWPLISGSVAALEGIGGSHPFPTAHTLGPGCTSAYPAIFVWAHTDRTLSPTLGIGYLSWFALLAGVIAVIRSSGRGRRGWEPFGVLLVALAPVVWQPLVVEFHPQDYLAMGLVLGGIACFQRGWWIWSGILLGLAVTSQQFALLVLVPLFVLASGSRRWRLGGAAAGAWLLVGLPFVAIGGRNALNGLILGTGDWFTYGGTVLWETGLRGQPMVFCSRVLPLLVSAAIAWWAGHYLGKRVFEPAIVLSLLATTLSLRLVFEQGLFGYKFMALGVMLVILCVVRGKRIGETVTWLVLVSLAWNSIPFGLAFNGRPWGHSAAVALPLVAAAVFLALIIWWACKRHIRWYLVLGLSITLGAFVSWPPWAVHLRSLPTWLLQLIVLPAGIALAADALVAAMRIRSGHRSDQKADSDVIEAAEASTSECASEPLVR